MAVFKYFHLCPVPSGYVYSTHKTKSVIGVKRVAVRQSDFENFAKNVPVKQLPQHSQKIKFSKQSLPEVNKLSEESNSDF